MAYNMDKIQEAQELLQKIEQEKFKAFEDGYKELCEKTGYCMSPCIVMKSSGIDMHLEIVKTK
jgi:hypothetical protein